MKALKFIILSYLLCFSFRCTPPQNPGQLIEEDPPNILFILVDDLGKEWLSCYESNLISTPNIDSFARSGTLFNNVYAMPQCTPTRLTLLTGQYPYRHGWVNHWDVPRWGGGAHYDETMYPSLPKALQNSGYRTAVAGKWQVDDFRVEQDALTKAGFDEFCVWTGFETGVAESANRYFDPYIYSSEGSSVRKGLFGPDVFTEFLIDFISADSDKPFFAYYPMVLTHTPFVTPPDENATTNLEKHMAMVRYTDQLTGHLIAAVQSAGIEKNTLIIWTTDNGTSSRITGIRNGRPIEGGKSKTLESGICVPFIASWPGRIPQNEQSNAVVDFTDMLPTLLDLAGIPTEELGDFEIDGQSFLPSLLRPTLPSTRKWIMAMGGGNHAELTENGVENQFRFRDRVLRNERFKLYIDHLREPTAFYDLKLDPYEESNLINNLNTEEIRKNYHALKSVISTFPIQDSDPKYTPNPPQDWDVSISAKSQEWKL